MAEFWYRLVTPRKRHCLAKLTLYMHIGHVCDGLYASWRVKATLRYRFRTLDRKPRPRSQSYIGPTTVGFDSPQSQNAGKPDAFIMICSSFVELVSYLYNSYNTYTLYPYPWPCTIDSPLRSQHGTVSPSLAEGAFRQRWANCFRGQRFFEEIIRGTFHMPSVESE